MFGQMTLWVGGMKVPRVSKVIFLVAVVCVATGCEEGRATHDPAIPSVETTSGPLPEKGPDEYWAKLETTRGPLVIEVHRAWSPYGADRFYELVKSGFYDRCKFFRVAGFVVQFGMSGDPRVSAKWHDANIPDDQYQRRDRNRQSNKRGYVTFAKPPQMPNSRTTQIFVNCIDNSQLDQRGFTPFGVVISGMDAIDALYSGYGEEPSAPGSQDRIEKEGDAYLNAAFPKLDSIKTAVILPGKPKEAQDADESKKLDEAKKADESKKGAEPKPNASPPAPAKKPAG
jgi:peptidyl-prolyl cis-trans isomerase A (cyclophilin A)